MDQAGPAVTAPDSGTPWYLTPDGRVRLEAAINELIDPGPEPEPEAE